MGVDFGGDRELQTTTSFNPRQLHNYQFDGEPSVTFSIKELKVARESEGEGCMRLAVDIYPDMKREVNLAMDPEQSIRNSFLVVLDARVASV